MLAALSLALASAAAVQAMRPAQQPTVAVVVAAHNLDAGTALSTDDLTVTRLPSALVPAQAVADPDMFAGAASAVMIPAGLPVVPSLLAGGTPAGPEGTVVTAIRLDDDGVATLLRPGDRIDLLATDDLGGQGVVVARRALVLTAAQQADGSLLDAAEATPLVVAVQEDEVAALAGAMSGLSHLVAFVVP